MRIPLGFNFRQPRYFSDRSEAGRRLAQRLLKYKGKDAVVLAIPRGGVVVAVEVASALEAPLDVVIPRKIGAPENPELAIGAVGPGGEVVINEAVRSELGVPDSYIAAEVQRQLAEIDRRERLYLGDRQPFPIEGKIAILVDDGLATGYTAIAAARSVRARNPQKIALAVPVAPPDTCERLSKEVDEIICLETPELFFAVGQFYADFTQVSDVEVVEILKRYSEWRA